MDGRAQALERQVGHPAKAPAHPLNRCKPSRLGMVVAQGGIKAPKRGRSPGLLLSPREQEQPQLERVDRHLSFSPVGSSSAEESSPAHRDRQLGHEGLHQPPRRSQARSLDDRSRDLENRPPVRNSAHRSPSARQANSEPTSYLSGSKTARNFSFVLPSSGGPITAGARTAPISSPTGSTDKPEGMSHGGRTRTQPQATVSVSLSQARMHGASPRKL